MVVPCRLTVAVAEYLRPLMQAVLEEIGSTLLMLPAAF